jgi:predicted HD superfamily hydrolase involved in NAD metabolism
MTVKEIRRAISGRLSKRRYEHSVSVSQTAEKLALKYGADSEKAVIAGLLHDVTKELDRDAQLQLCARFGIILTTLERSSAKILHAITAPLVVKTDFNIKDADVLGAIRYHTTGRAGMTTLEKIVFLADYIEPLREYSGIANLRKTELKGDLDAAVLACFDFSFLELMKKKAPIHPDALFARNTLLLSRQHSPDSRCKQLRASD